ncbi:MAG: DUF4388 domain-containing protein [Actinomycetota bacterium]
MLQGTFDTLSFAEVLRLLASGHKTGALRMDAGVAATLWMEHGACRAVEGGDLVEPLADGGELLARLVDVGFAIARTGGGTFRFMGDEAAPWRTEAVISVEDVLAEVGGLLTQWRQIEQIVPSLDCRPVLADELKVDHLDVDADLWKLLVRIDGRRSVRDLAHRTGRSVLDLCYTLMDLAAAGAIGIVPEPERARAPHRLLDGTVQPEEPYGPGVESPHPGPTEARGDGVVVGAAAGNGSGDRGALLRVFSALRDE